MATTLTQLTITPTVFPFETIEARQSYYPRGELRYQWIRQAITAGGLGNEQSVVIKFNLPRNFSYRMREAFMSVSPDSGAPNWSDNGQVVLTDGGTATRTYRYQVPFNSNGSLGGDEVITAADGKVYSVAPGALPTFVLKEAVGGGASVFLSVFNSTQDDPAAETSGFASFLIYDINQAFATTVNTPIPVQGR